jgi:hypothetical protein
LYRYDFNTGKLLYLGGAVSPPGPTGVQAVSEDASHVYFTSLGTIYLSVNGVTRAVTSTDPVVGYRRIISPSGEYFAIMTAESLTSYDTAGLQEVYLYDAATETLTCASCPQDGSPSTGDATLPWLVQELGNNSMPNALTDGGQLFFDTPTKLVHGDVNGKLDVYAYKDGRVSLISPGTGNFQAGFLDASASGNDVFFKTTQPLVRQDTDGQYDVYDARVGGGIAGQNAVASPSCSGDGCQGALSTNPDLSPPATRDGGPGNVTAHRHKGCGKQPWAKGKARCGKKRHKKHRGGGARRSRANSTRRAGR